MTRVPVALCLSLAALTLAAQPAQAQPAPAPSAQPQAAPPVPYRFYLSVDAGAEVKSQTLSVPGSFPLYGETATFTSTVAINNAPMVNLEGGGRLWRNLFGSAAFTWRLKSSSGSDVTASIPHPLYGGEPRTATTNVSPLEHYQSAIHISLAWEMKVAEKATVRFFGGPSFFGVKQDVVSAITVQEAGAPYTSVTISGATLTRLSDFGAVGYNVGLDGTYMFSRRVGAGVLVRLAGGTVDLTGPGDMKFSVDAGGFDVGLGIRVRF